MSLILSLVFMSGYVLLALWQKKLYIMNIIYYEVRSAERLLTGASNRACF